MVDGVATCVDTCSVCPADTGCTVTDGVATCTAAAPCEWATPCPPGYVCEATGCVATCDNMECARWQECAVINNEPVCRGNEANTIQNRVTKIQIADLVGKKIILLG